MTSDGIHHNILGGLRLSCVFIILIVVAVIGVLA